MYLIPYNETRDLNRAEDAFDRLFERAFGLRPFASQAPAVDYDETDEGYTVRATVPGFKKDQLEVSAQDGLLTITAHQAAKEGEKQTENSLRRSVRLPEGIDVEKVSAHLEDGILTVTLPKAETRKPRAIQIR